MARFVKTNLADSNLVDTSANASTEDTGSNLLSPVRSLTGTTLQVRSAHELEAHTNIWSSRRVVTAQEWVTVHNDNITQVSTDASIQDNILQVNN